MVHPPATTPKPARRSFTLLELLIVVAIISILAAIAIPNFMEAQTRAKVARVKAEMRNLETAVMLYHCDWNAYPAMVKLDHVPVYYRDCGYCNFLCYDSDPNETYGVQTCPNCLTTPVAYLAAPPPRDPFIGTMRLWDTDKDQMFYPGTRDRRNCSYYFYNFKGAARWAVPLTATETWPYAPAPLRLNGPTGPVYRCDWAMLSPGPDRTFTVVTPDGEHYASFQYLATQREWLAMKAGIHSIYDPSNGTVSGGDIWRTSQGAL